MNEVTQILHSIEQGDSNAAQKLLPLVYEELLCARGAQNGRRGGGTDIAANRTSS